MVQKNEDCSESVIRLTSDQFSHLHQVKTYPGMCSLCRSMRFREIPLAECVRLCLPNSRFSWNLEVVGKRSGNLQEASRIATECLRVPVSVQEWFFDGKKVREKSWKFRDFVEICWFLVFSAMNEIRVSDWSSCIASVSRRKALRVIPRGKQWLTVYRAHQVDSKGVVKKWCKWIRKMRISQNSWVRLTSDHFSR